MEGIINFVALGFSSVALIFDIVAIALPSWFSVSGLHYGLWKSCTTNIYGAENCEDLVFDTFGADLSPFIIATRALTIIGLLLLAASIAMALLKIFVLKDKVILSSWAISSASAAGTLTIVGAIVFAVKTIALSGGKFDALGVGFRLAVSAGVIAIIAGIIFKLGKNK